MKKILTVFLTVCLLASVVACFAVSAHAEDIQVTVGQVFEWNDQSGDSAKELAWRRGGGTSPDGLWKYQFYALKKGIYQDLVFASGNQYAWNPNPGSDDNGIGYARVRQMGKNFHPATGADVVKVFTAPSGGSIQISSTVARSSDLKAGGSATGTSFAIYVEDRLVYPEEGNGEYLTLVSKNPQTIDVTVDVSKGERVRIRIGAIGNQSSDAIDMSNTITYKSINDEVAGEVSDVTLDFPKYTNGASYTIPDLPGADDDNGGDRELPTDNGGMNVGVIVGIVVGAVAVVGIAVAVVVIMKKKKQE